MSTTAVGMQGREARQQFTRGLGVFAPIVIVVYAGLQTFYSQTQDDPVVRELWLEDLTAQVVLGAAAAGVAFFVGRWAARRERRAQVRCVVGLAVGAAVLGPLVWWSAAPVLLAGGAVVLGRVSGVTERDGGSGAARILMLLAGLVAAASFAVLSVSVIVNAF